MPESPTKPSDLAGEVAAANRDAADAGAPAEYHGEIDPDAAPSAATDAAEKTLPKDVAVAQPSPDEADAPPEPDGDDVLMVCDKVCVQIVSSPTESDGRAGAPIHLPETRHDAKDPTRGMVVAVGPDCKQVKVGDRVFVEPHVGQDFELQRIKYYVLPESGIVAIIRKSRKLPEGPQQQADEPSCADLLDGTK